MRYTAVVAVVAGALLAGDAWLSRGVSPVGGQLAAFLFFVGCCLVTEVRPIRWLRNHEGGEVTASWTFILTLLLIGSPLVAVASGAAVVLIGDLSTRKAAAKIVFNVSQFTVALSLGAMALVWTGQTGALAASGPISWQWFPALVLTAAILFGVNTSLTFGIIAIHRRVPLLGVLRTAGLNNLSTDGMLLALSPVFVVVERRSFLLVIPLLITTWAVYHSAELALARRHEANHDLLTQLPNRRLFTERLDTAIHAAEKRGGKVGLIVMDLDHFKGINDRLGHHVGDEVLTTVAGRLSAGMRSQDLLARLGGDEFAIVVPDADTIATVESIAWRLLSTFDAPCVTEGFPLSLGASLGVAVLPDHGDDAHTLLRRADEAMYSAKTRHVGVHVYQRTGEETGVGRLSLITDLTHAVERGELFLEFQPQVDLRTGETVGFEALVRWQHPTMGVVQPGVFMPLLEQTELIAEVTDWVLRAALRECAAWHRAGCSLRVAVNISARNIQDVRFPARVINLLDEIGTPEHLLDLEITENTVALDRAVIRSVLNELRTHGVSISVDDFGTGYSSMAQLRELPIDQIKIDRTFVGNMAVEARDALIVRSLVQLGRSLGIQTVAEGVEGPLVAQMLCDLGCDVAQGFFYGRPVSAAEVRDQLSRPIRRPAGVLATLTEVAS